jgi:membrane fusion protein, multidrug efflux system
MPTDTDGPNALLVKRLRLGGIVTGCVAAAIIVIGLAMRFYIGGAVARWTADQTIPTVSTVLPVTANAANTLILPGTLQAFYNARIYARVPGYLRAWYKDIGAQVHKGDVLAVIDTPELDQQIEQARADLQNAVAARDLSQSTAKRWSSLLTLDAVSKQEAEEKASDMQAKTALVAAAKANLDRLNDLKGFAKITAPFDGIVTNRTIDVGALINAGSESNGSPLFTVADIHRIRIYVSVPQNYSAEIKPGVTAQLSLPEYPGRVFSAPLDASANAITEKSDSLLVEFLADNSQNQLKPGGYAQVTIHVPTQRNVVTVPASALIFDENGLQVATVGAGDRIRMKHIKIARDLGTEVEIESGIDPRDRIVDNPPDSIANGDRVHPEQASSAQ